VIPFQEGTEVPRGRSGRGECVLRSEIKIGRDFEEGENGGRY